MRGAAEGEEWSSQESSDEAEWSSEEEEEKDDDGSSSNEKEKTISVEIDPEVLDCPICLERLSAPVFQCQNGHITCSSCWTKVKNKCHSCASKIGHIRCRAIEKVIESIKTPCRHARYGCKEMLSLSNKSAHEECCAHAPCRCPISNCEFIGSSAKLALHFTTNHEDCTDVFKYNCPVQVCMGKREPLSVLLGEDGRLFFVINRNEHVGNLVFVTGVGQSSPKGGYAYDLVARKGTRSLQLKSFTKTATMHSELAPPTDYLVVPCDFYTSRQLMLDVCIRSTRELG